MKSSNDHSQAAWDVVLDWLTDHGETLEDAVYFGICYLRDQGDWSLYQRRELHSHLLGMGLTPDQATGIINRGSDEALGEIGKQAAPPLPPMDAA